MDEQIAALETALIGQDALLHALSFAMEEADEGSPLDMSHTTQTPASNGQEQNSLSPRPSGRGGFPGETRRSPSDFLQFPKGRVASGSSFSRPRTSLPANLGSLPGSQKVIIGLAEELMDLRTQRATVQGSLARARRDRDASKAELDSAREVVPDLRLCVEKLQVDVQERDQALADATSKAERAEAETLELEKAGSEWDARVDALEKEVADVAREKERSSAQINALQAAWETTRPSWDNQLKTIRNAAQDRRKERQKELSVVQEKTARMESLAEQREAEQGDLLAVLDQWQTQRDRLLGLLRNRVPGLNDDLAKAAAASVPASPHSNPASCGGASPSPSLRALAPAGRGEHPPMRRLPMASHFLMSPGTPSALDQQIDRAIRDVQDVVRRSRSGIV